MFDSCNDPKKNRVGRYVISFFCWILILNSTCFTAAVVVMQCSNPLIMLIGSWKGGKTLG